MGGGAGEFVGGHLVAVFGFAGVPVGCELGLGELVEDVAHDRAVDHGESAFDPELATGFGDPQIASGQAGFVAPMGAVGVGQLFPAVAGDLEVEELQIFGGVDQHATRHGEQVAAAWVGAEPGELSNLWDADPGP